MYGWGVGGEGGVPVASDVGAGVGARDFFFGLEGACSVSGLCEEGAGELGERLGEVGVVCGEEGEEGLLEGAVHGGDGGVGWRGRVRVKLGLLFCLFSYFLSSIS